MSARGRGGGGREGGRVADFVFHSPLSSFLAPRYSLWTSAIDNPSSRSSHHLSEVHRLLQEDHCWTRVSCTHSNLPRVSEGVADVHLFPQPPYLQHQIPIPSPRGQGSGEGELSRSLRPFASSTETDVPLRTRPGSYASSQHPRSRSSVCWSCRYHLRVLV